MKTKSNVIFSIISLFILAVALTLTLLDALIPLGIWLHPALTFLFVNFAGFGIMVTVFAVMKKSPWFFFISALLIGFALFYVLIFYLAWWLALIIVVAVWTDYAVLSLIIAGNQTENIALNKSEDYKTFEERNAEQAAQAEKEPEETQELPKLKSFKD